MYCVIVLVCCFPQIQLLNNVITLAFSYKELLNLHEASYNIAQHGDKQSQRVF